MVLCVVYAYNLTEDLITSPLALTLEPPLPGTNAHWHEINIFQINISCWDQTKLMGYTENSVNLLLPHSLKFTCQFLSFPKEEVVFIFLKCYILRCSSHCGVSFHTFALKRVIQKHHFTCLKNITIAKNCLA